MALGTLWTVIQQASGVLALTSRRGTAISEPWLTGDASPGFLRYKVGVGSARLSAFWGWADVGRPYRASDA